MINGLFGMQLIESPMLVDYVQDWSRVRSPSRARRRMKRGHRQNVRTVAVPKKEAVVMGNKIIVHPAIAAQVRAQIHKAGGSPL